jgi:hypothetical protein
VIRLRQGVVASRSVEPLASDLRRELGLGAPFEDDGVGEFGLRNSVMALGDTFIEVIAPVDAGAPAGRFLERHGPGGYMLIVQVDDVAAARRRAADAGVRVVWQADLPDISGTHLHPRDIGGTLLSVDEARPPRTWRWGGPAWTGRTPDRVAPVGLAGATVAARKAAQTAARWAAVLGTPAPRSADDGAAELVLDGGVIRFVDVEDREGITVFDVRVDGDARRGRERLEAGGVAFHLTS